MRIVVLAGGSDQIALINALKQRGHYIILVDYFENPPAKSYADEHVVASTLDVERVKEIAVSRNAGLICTACTDQALLTVANVSEQLNLPCYISYSTALNVTNKSYMKRRMREFNIPTSGFVILDKADMELVKHLSYPMVVKPVDCNSSKGVRKVADEKELVAAIEQAVRLSRTSTAVVEEFKEGIEISADFYIEGGNAKFLSATSSLKIRNRDSFTIAGSAYPAVDDGQRQRITQIASDIASAFGLTDCPLLVQLIVGKDNIDVIEFSARMGGGSKYYLIEELSGVDIMSKYVDLILGDTPTVKPEVKLRYCRMVYVYCRPGVISEVKGLDELEAEGVIRKSFLYKTSGMSVTASETSGDRAAGYLVVAETENELQRKISAADAAVRVLTPDGEDIMIHNLM